MSIAKGKDAVENAHMSIVRGEDVIGNAHMSIGKGEDVIENAHTSIVKEEDVIENVQVSIFAVVGVPTNHNFRCLVKTTTMAKISVSAETHVVDSATRCE